MDQGGGRNIELAQAKPVRTGGASSSKSLSVSGVTAGIAGMDIDTNTGIGASAGAGSGGQGNNNAIPGNLPNSVTATSAITPPSMPSMRGSPLDQPRSRHPTSPTAPPTPPSASAATSKGKGKFKLDPYSLLLPHERKMYQQSQSSSAPGSGSASPQSNPGSVGPSPTNNALKLGRMAPHGHGQGQGAYTAFEQGHKQVQMQMQPQAHVQQGVAGAHMQAGPGAQRQSHVQGQAQSPQQAQAHFYHGQGHEQWQTSIQGAATGGQQPQGTATRLVSSMGEQGSHGRQAQPTGRLYQPPPPPQAAPLSPPASAFTPSSPAWDVMSTTSTAAYGGQVDVGNTAATREWARHQASGSNAPGNNAGAATTAGAAGRYKFGSGPPSHPAQSLRGSGKARLEDWEIVETLGTGTFGRVLLVRQRPSYRPTAYHPIFPHLFQSLDPLSPSPASTAQADGQLPHFAMKVLRKSEVVRLKQVEHINSERAILERIRHPFVVELYATYQDSLNVYMLLSYIPGGELFSHLRRAGRFSADVTRFYLASIVLAIDYLHAKNIIYRDLKPENLLLDRVGYLRIADFGFAKVVEDRTFTLCGTPEYLAPEIVLSQGHGKAVDWWALGILAFEMLAGYPPFFDDHTLGIYEKILRNEVAFPSHVDPYAKDLIRGLLTADRSKRLGNLKGGARDVMGHPWFAGVDWGSLERKEIGAPIIPRVSNMGDSQNFQRYPPPRPHELPGIFGQTYKSTGDQYAELFTAFTFPEDATRTREQSRTSRAQSVAVEQGQHRGPEQMRQPTESGGDTAME